MATNAEDLQEIKNNIIAKLKEITSHAGHKPTYTIDGKSVSWNEYREKLLTDIKTINELLALENPYEMRSQGIT